MRRRRHYSPLVLLAALVLAPLVFGQTTCPDQAYPPLTGYSVAIDPNRVAYDRNDPNDPNYAERRQLLLRVITVPLGRTAIYDGYACDPTGDALTIRAYDGTVTALTGGGEPVAQTPVNGWLSLVAGGRYRWAYTPTSIGVTYHNVESQDVRPETDDARSTRGTIVVVAVPRNAHPPRLCGGQPR